MFFAHGESTCRILNLTILIWFFSIAKSSDSTVTAESVSQTSTGELALAVFRRQYLSRALVFKGQCSSDWGLFRKLLGEFQTGIITTSTLWRLDYIHFRTGILVDLRRCPIGKIMFQKGVVQPYFNSSYRWFVISDTPLEETAQLFQDRNFRLDTSITAALFRGDSYVLMDLYKLSTSDAVLNRPVGQFRVGRLTDWVDAENAPFRSKVHRNLTTGLHVLKLTSEPANVVMERFNRLRGHPEVPATHFSMQDFHVYLALCELFNISINPRVYNFSGYPDANNVYSGLLGGLQQHKIEISASKLLIDVARMTIDEYHVPCDLFELKVVYYVGSTLETPGALFQPFAPSLWIGIAVACAALILGLWYAGHWEMQSDNREADLTATATILLILGNFNGQGHVTEVRWYSTRTVIIVALLMGYLLVSVYNAVIVRSLLSTPEPNIRDRRDFMASPLTMAVEDYYHFSKAIFNEKMSDAMRELYNNKIVLPKGGGFRPVSDGFPGMLSQRWAIFAQANNILLEMAKATPGQICRLAWIRDIGAHVRRMVCPLMAKKSDLKNLLTRGYLLARERGLHDRARQRHCAARVSCQPEHRRQWAPVRIQIVLAAIGIVLGGLLAALLLLVQELLRPKKKSVWKWSEHVPLAWK